MAGGNAYENLVDQVTEGGRDAADARPLKMLYSLKPFGFLARSAQAGRFEDFPAYPQDLGWGWASFPTSDVIAANDRSY